MDRGRSTMTNVDKLATTSLLAMIAQVSAKQQSARVMPVAVGMSPSTVIMSSMRKAPPRNPSIWVLSRLLLCLARDGVLAERGENL